MLQDSYFILYNDGMAAKPGGERTLKKLKQIRKRSFDCITLSAMAG